MKKTRFLTHGAIIGSAYVALNMLFLPIAFLAIQFRVAEALTLLPLLFPSSVLGLFVGCIIANLSSPFGIVDIFFGSLATLAGAYGTYLIGKKVKNSNLALALAPLPTIISNTFIIGGVLYFMLNGTPDAAPYHVFAAQIFIGETGVCYLLGVPLIMALRKLKIVK